MLLRYSRARRIPAELDRQSDPEHLSRPSRSGQVNRSKQDLRMSPKQNEQDGQAEVTKRMQHQITEDVEGLSLLAICRKHRTHDQDVEPACV